MARETVRGRATGTERNKDLRARLGGFEREAKQRKLARLTEEQQRRRTGESHEPTRGRAENASTILGAVDTSSPAGTYEQVRDGRREKINQLGTAMESAQATLKALDEQSIGATRELAEIQRMPDVESAKQRAAEVEARLTQINEQRKIARKQWEDTFTARDTETRALLSLLDQRVKDIQEGRAVLTPRPLDPNAANPLPGPNGLPNTPPGLNPVPLPGGITPQNQLPRGFTQAPLNRPDLDMSQENGMTSAEKSGRENLRRILARGGVLTRMEEALYQGVPEQNVVKMSTAIDILNKNAGGWKKFKWALATGAVTVTALAVSQVLLPGSLPFLVNGLGSLYAGVLPASVANWSVPLVLGGEAFKIGVPAAMAAGTIGGIASGYIGSLMERRRARRAMRDTAAARNLGTPVFQNDWKASRRTLFRTSFGGVVGTIGGAAFESTGVGPVMREYVSTQASSFGDWLSSVLSQRTNARLDALDVRFSGLENSVDGQSITMDQMMRTIETMRRGQGRISSMVAETLGIVGNLESQLGDVVDQLSTIQGRLSVLGPAIREEIRLQIGSAVAGIINPHAPGAMSSQQIDTLLRQLQTSQDRGFQEIFAQLQQLRGRVGSMAPPAFSALQIYTGLGAPNPWDAVTSLAHQAGVRLPVIEQNVLNHAIGLLLQDNPHLLQNGITDVRRIPNGTAMNFDFLRGRANYDAVLSIVDRTRVNGGINDQQYGRIAQALNQIISSRGRLTVTTTPSR